MRCSRIPCLTTSEETIDIEASPAGLVGELTANPNLFAGEPTEVEVAGHPGLQVDVTTQQPMVCDPPVTALWSIPDRGLFMLETGQEARFIPLEVDGQVLVLVIEAFPAPNTRRSSPARPRSSRPSRSTRPRLHRRSHHRPHPEPTNGASRPGALFDQAVTRSDDAVERHGSSS